MNARRHSNLFSSLRRARKRDATLLLRAPYVEITLLRRILASPTLRVLVRGPSSPLPAPFQLGSVIIRAFGRPRYGAIGPMTRLRPQHYSPSAQTAHADFDNTEPRAARRLTQASPAVKREARSWRLCSRPFLLLPVIGVSPRRYRDADSCWERRP